MNDREFEYRVIYHEPQSKMRVHWPSNGAEDNTESMAERLDRLVESGQATGGHIETFVDNIGWVIDS